MCLLPTYNIKSKTFSLTQILREINFFPILFHTGKGSVLGRSLHTKSRTKQNVNSLLTSDHELRDLSNQSFVFNELHQENVLCVAFDPFKEEVAAGGM